MEIEIPQKIEEIIIKAASVHFGLEVKEYTENRSKDHYSSYQRFIAIYLLRENTLLSFEAIGKFFGRKDCTTRNGYNQISGLEAIKDRRTITDIREITSIIDSFTEQKKKNYS
ncbi:helix-turn-helix domain-containing protein [Pedobacter sp. Hv1]|uniref:helix-turn-helix domain-containing protein n=1 Tax=Pedobacter sp. Hv1 TaxID=1740090 RepID=UPI0006D8C3B4|nr:helix-turn-helix domain-containing protein [Pedobacter sp. Hv1]KQC02088.1 hypothetical protein AQF98_00505 [Pedobacter sp. Hv1]